MTRSVLAPAQRDGGATKPVRKEPWASSMLVRSDSPTTVAWAAGSASALLLLAVAPLTLVNWQTNVATPLNVCLALTIIGFSSWRISRSILTGGQDLLRSFFYVFVFVFLGISALAQSARGVFPNDGRTYTSSIIAISFVHILVGIIAYEVGWFLSTKQKTRTRPTRGAWGFSPRRTAVMACIGLLISGYQVQRYGIGTFFISRQETTNVLAGQGLGDSGQFYTVDDKTLGVLTIFLSQYPIFISLFAILYCRRHRLWPKGSKYPEALWNILIVLLVVANVIMNNPIGNARFWFLVVFAAFASIYFPYQRAWVGRTFVAGALLALIFVFSSLDAFRNTDVVNFQLTSPEEALTQNPTYAVFQTQLNATIYVGENGHTLGQQTIGSIFSFVPRSLWSDKPGATGQLVDSKFLRSATAWGEMNVDFGPMGIAVFFLLYGFGSAVLARRATYAPPGLLQAILPAAATFQILLLRGSLQPAIGVMYQLLIILALIAARRATQDAAHQGSG